MIGRGRRRCLTPSGRGDAARNPDFPLPSCSAEWWRSVLTITCGLFCARSEAAGVGPTGGARSRFVYSSREAGPSCCLMTGGSAGNGETSGRRSLSRGSLGCVPRLRVSRRDALWPRRWARSPRAGPSPDDSSPGALTSARVAEGPSVFWPAETDLLSPLAADQVRATSNSNEL